MNGDLPVQPLLPSLYHVLHTDTDHLLIVGGDRMIRLSGDRLAQRGAPLLRALDGRSTVPQLQSRFSALGPGSVTALLQALLAKGVLTEGWPQDPDRHDGSLVATTDWGATAVALAAPSPAAVAAGLRQATVAIIGCGAVGGATAVLLAKAGIGRLILVDDQPLVATQRALSPYLFASADTQSVAAAIAQCCRAAGCADVREPAAADQAELGSIDLAVIERRPSQPSLADVCLAMGTHYLTHGQDGLEAIVGPLVLPGNTACHRCADTRADGRIERLDEVNTYRQHRAVHAPRPDAFLAAHAALVAGLMTTECLTVLANGRRRGKSGVWIIDLSQLTVRREEILPVPGCVGCASVNDGPPEIGPRPTTAAPRPARSN